jgi:hypothetical protein
MRKEKQTKKKRDFRKTENKQAGNNRDEDRREYNQTVGHYLRPRKCSQPRSPYNRRARQGNLGKLQWKN